MYANHIIKFHKLRLLCVPTHYYTRNALLPRYFSLQSTIQSVAATQANIFKTLSESTPVEYAQNFLTGLHDTTGLPWWATIVCTTILLRTCVTVPLSLYQSYILAKLENLTLEMPDIVKELKRETAIAIKMFNWDEKTARIQYNRSLKKQWNNLILRDNCHPFKASFLIWFQIPMWISLSISIRNLVQQLPQQNPQSELIFNQLAVEGFGWIQNLTMTDPSLILPILFGLLNLSIIEIQYLSKIRVSSKLQKYATNFFRGISIIMIPLAATVPSCLVLYWTTSSAFGLIQNLVLMSPKVKRLFKIPKTPSELEHPYQHLKAGIKQRFKFISVLQ